MFEFSVTDSPSWGCKAILRNDGIKAEAIATVKMEYAERVVILLNRHGMNDCTIDDLAAAVLDLEQRQ